MSVLATIAVVAGASLFAGAPGATAARSVRLHQSSAPNQVCPVGTVCTQQPRTTLSLTPHKGGSGFKPLPRPPVTEMDTAYRPPQGLLRPPKNIGPPTVSGGSSPTGAVARAFRDQTALRANVPVKTVLKTDLGVPPGQNAPQEPTTAQGDGVVWYTGNTSVALSTNSGGKFTYFNPSTILPDGTLSFCCDQVVTYSPQAHLFVWVMQYWCGKGTTKPATTYCPTAGTTSNRIRLAVATPSGLKANASSPGFAWTYWDFTPQSFSGIGATRTTWFDQSKMGVNRVFLNWSIDVLRDTGNVSTIFGRINLDSLASGGTVTMHWNTDTHQKINVAQGLSTGNSYFVGNNSAGQERIWSWPNGGSATLHTINHSTVPTYNAVIDGTTGSNWYSRWGIFPGAVESATLKGSTLYVAQGTGTMYCTANCSSSTPTLKARFYEPAVFVSEYSTVTWKKVAERWYYNGNVAFGWPALDTNGAGDVGMVFRESKPGQNAQPAALFVTSGARFYSLEPEGLPFLTGDYYSLRPGPTSKTFVMTGQTVKAGPNMHWDYIEWGR
jgi:hypothetical protein